MDYAALFSAISEFARQNGPWAGCLVLVGVFAWRALTWFGTNMGLPLFNRLMKFIDAAEGMFGRQTGDVAEIKASIARMEERQSEHILICRGEPRQGLASPR